MSFIIPLVWIFLVNGFSVKLFKKKFEICLPFTLITHVLFLFLTGFIHNISLGYYFGWLIAVLFCGWITWDIFKENNDALNLFFENYFSIGTIIFIILYIYLFLLFRLRGFSFWDEYGHWGIMVRETLRINDFYAVPESILHAHKDYPPFITLLEVLWCKLSGNSYTESYLYRGLQIFMFSLYLPLFSSLNKKNIKDWLKAVILTLIFVLLGITLSTLPTASDNALFYNSIYADWPLAVLCAYLLWLVYSLKHIDKFNIANIIITCVALLMSKQMGLPLYLLVVVFALIKFLIFYFDNKILKKQLVYSYILIIIIPFIVFLSWNFIINNYDLGGQFDIGKISILDIIMQTLTNSISIPWQVETNTNFTDAIFNRVLMDHPINLTYFAYIFLILLILIFIYLCFRKSTNKYVNLSLILLYGLGSVGYAVAMYILYMSSFGTFEGPALASFNRYMLTYLFIGNCLLIMISTWLINEYSNHDLIGVSVVLLVLLAFINSESIRDILITNEYRSNRTVSYTEAIKDIKELESDTKLLIIQQWQSGSDLSIMYKYDLLYTNIDYEMISLREKLWLTDYAVILSQAEWITLLKEFDYLYTLYPDEYFIENYWTPITETELLNRRIFRIIENDGVVNLELK